MNRILLLAALATAVAGSASAQPLMERPKLLADANHDEKVTLVEYQTSRRTGLMKADRDHDGKISQAEWTAAAKMLRSELESEGVQGAELVGRGGGFQRINTNGDGFVTPDEIDAFFKVRFALIDTDHDGVANRTEIAAAEKRAKR